jgi:hypothetical protein
LSVKPMSLQHRRACHGERVLEAEEVAALDGKTSTEG